MDGWINKLAAWREERGGLDLWPTDSHEMGRCAADCKQSQLFNQCYFPLTCNNIQVSGLGNTNPSPWRMLKEELLDKIQNFAHCTCGGCTDYNVLVHAWWVTEALEQEVKLVLETYNMEDPVGSSFCAPDTPSCLNSEKHFHLSSCSFSFSVDVMVFKTSVLWCHQWLFIVYVLDNCDDA